jgi:hypothetical protein
MTECAKVEQEMQKPSKKESSKNREKKMSGHKTFYEAAKRCGVSYWSLWRGAEAGFFKTVYFGGRRMIPESELAYIEKYGFGGRKRRGHKADVEIREAHR